MTLQSALDLVTVGDQPHDTGQIELERRTGGRNSRNENGRRSQKRGEKDKN